MEEEDQEGNEGGTLMQTLSEITLIGLAHSHVTIDFSCLPNTLFFREWF